MNSDDKYKNFVKNFKPEFGNKEHIELLAVMTKIKKDQTALEKSIEQKKAGKALKANLAKLKKHAVYVFEKDALNF